GLNTSRNSGAILLENLAYGDEISLRANTNGTLTNSYASIHRIETSGRVYKTRVAWLKEVRANNTSGGAFTSGGWRDRTFNTSEGDTSFVSLNTSTGEFELQPGTYKIESINPAYKVARHVAKLRDTSNSADIII